MCLQDFAYTMSFAYTTHYVAFHVCVLPLNDDGFVTTVITAITLFAVNFYEVLMPLFCASSSLAFSVFSILFATIHFICTYFSFLYSQAITIFVMLMMVMVMVTMIKHTEIPICD